MIVTYGETRIGSVRRLDIRCCCNPEIIIGSVPIPDSFEVTSGAQLKVHAGTELVTLTVQRWSFAQYLPSQNGTDSDRLMSRGYAFISEDRPLELFQRIKGFIPSDYVLGMITMDEAPTESHHAVYVPLVHLSSPIRGRLYR